MAQPKHLVCFVEGKGDKTAVPILARRVLKEIQANDVLVVDAGMPFEVDGIGKLVKTEKGKSVANWLRWLEAAGRDKNLGGVLLVLDGDVERVMRGWKSYAERYHTDTFCARDAARTLADDARAARGGEAFSVAVVFAMKEFEAWLLAGVESLRGRTLADGRGTVPNDAKCPEIDVEAKRGAKEEFKAVVPGYEQSLDQGVLARDVDLARVHDRCRSFRRFRSAIEQLADAIRSGQHVASPHFLEGT